MKRILLYSDCDMSFLAESSEIDFPVSFKFLEEVPADSFEPDDFDFSYLQDLPIGED